MIAVKVAKMGNMRLLNVTSTGLRLGQVVELKPRGVDIHTLRQVVKQGDRRVIIIPKIYWVYFKHGSEVFVCQKEKKNG